MLVLPTAAAAAAAAAARALLLFSLAALATAAPAAQLDPRDATRCGSVSYSSTAVQAAADAACGQIQEQQQQQQQQRRASSYPHRYNNYEGFDFNGVPGPYNEFPILKSGRTYASGPPGPDRVIITDSCDLAGVITHSGARGNNFVGCSGTS
ncbi:Guanyl-specific ribonuclease F1 [Moelleriella libera RCEF 2490]|uniref:ribonuclease T1 n=1 Tax=Moelleriella libera RCEF 2490 TaxID=1081109 RepID=A0A168EW29_9HYPO|nr:Guanyl-specific ribonuclease F1 [Moelleriella libera RCEF 2490]